MNSRALDTELIKPKDQVQSAQKVSHVDLGKAMQFQGHSENAAALWPAQTGITLGNLNL